MLSVIVPNGGGFDTLKRLIVSMKNFDVFRNIEDFMITIVSQGNDGCGLEKIGDLLTLYGFKYLAINKKENIPPPIPYNDGIEIALKNEDIHFFVFVDDDVEFTEGSEGLFMRMMGLLSIRDFAIIGTERFYYGKNPIPADRSVDEVSMGCWMFPVGTFSKIGFLDEKFLWTASDSDYCRRVRSIEGRKVGVLTDSRECIIHHNPRAGTSRMEPGLSSYLRHYSQEYFKYKWENITNQRAKQIRAQHPLSRNRGNEMELCMEDFRKFQASQKEKLSTIIQQV